MFERLKSLAQSAPSFRPALSGAALAVRSAWGSLAAIAIAGSAVWLLYQHPPMQSVGPGELGIRRNPLTVETSRWRDGSVLVLPGLHDMRVFSMRDRSYRPAQSARADGPAPLQSLEGLSLGVDFAIRYALDPARLEESARGLPEDIGA